MLGHWQSTLAVRYPRPPMKGRAVFEGRADLTAEGHLGTALRGAAAFAGGADLTAGGVLRAQGAASFATGAELTAEGLATPPVYWYILGVGQSNLEGNGAALPRVSTSAPPNAKMFAGGIRPGTTGLTSFVPLLEGTGAATGETMLTGLAHRLGSVAAPNVFIFSTAASGGQAYSGIKKGTGPYADSLAQVAAAKALADAAGAVFKVLCVCLVHGETDDAGNNLAYSTNVATLQSDYETDLKAITGQSGLIPLFACQQAGSSGSGSHLYDGAGDSAVGVYNAWRANPAKICLPTPRYFFIHPDNQHLCALPQRWLGELYGKAIRAYFDSGTLFQTIYPTAAVLSGTTITVDFHVPVGPLVADYSLVQWRKTMGFSFTDDSGSSPTVTDAAIQPSGTQIVLTLSAEPTGNQKRLRYAYGGNKTYKTFAGLTDKAFTDTVGGNLRDSEATAPVYAHLPALHNYCPSFNIPVTT